MANPTKPSLTIWWGRLFAARGKAARVVSSSHSVRWSRCCVLRKKPGVLALERLWNELAKAYRFSFIALIRWTLFADEADLNAFFEICSEHALTIPAETPL